MFWLGFLGGLVICLVIFTSLFIKLFKGYLIIDFSIDNDQPFLLQITTNIDEVYNSKYVLLKTANKSKSIMTK